MCGVLGFAVCKAPPEEEPSCAICDVDDDDGVAEYVTTVDVCVVASRFVFVIELSRRSVFCIEGKFEEPPVAGVVSCTYGAISSDSNLTFSFLGGSFVIISSLTSGISGGCVQKVL